MSRLVGRSHVAENGIKVQGHLVAGAETAGGGKDQNKLDICLTLFTIIIESYWLLGVCDLIRH